VLNTTSGERGAVECYNMKLSELVVVLAGNSSSFRHLYSEIIDVHL
jgi:hypothetical protein